MNEGPFKAVDRAGLRAHLGSQCSPDKWREGYVIGPDANGRLCHVASCFSIGEARSRASELNERYHAQRAEVDRAEND